MRLKPVLTTLLAAVVLVLGTDYVSFAATGQSLILGHLNQADVATTLQRTTAGAPLALRATAGSAPLQVNQHVRVSNLNADLVDGKHAADLASSSRVYRGMFTASSGTHTLTVTMPAGTYLASYDVVMQGSHGTDTSVVGATCYLLQELVTNVVKDTFSATVTSATGGAFDNALSGSAQVTSANGTFLQLNCQSTTGWNSPSTQPATLVLTKIASTTNGSATVG